MQNKDRQIWTKNDKEKVQRGLKGKTIITTSFGIDEFLLVSQCETTKEMWDTLELTHEGTIKVRTTKMNTLTHDYELFRMKPEENIQDMKKYCIHIVNHMKTLGKVFFK